MKKKDGRGRKSLLNINKEGLFTDQVENFLKALKLGMSNVKGCELAGLNPDTIYDWLNKAEEDLEKGLDSKYVLFSERYKKARAECQALHLQNILRASQSGNWQASAWMLERIFPGSFSANQVNSAEDDKIEVVNDVPKM